MTTLPTALATLKADGADLLERLIRFHRLTAGLIDVAKASDATGAARAQIAVRDTNDAVNDAVTELNKLRQLLQTQIVPDMFQRANISSLTIDDNRVTISATLSVVMKDKIGGMDWLRDNDLGDIIQETVNSSTLKATIKKLIEDQGIEPPEELFTVTPVMNTSVTRVKKKA